MESAVPPDLNAALDRMWAQFQPQILERVAILEQAAKSFAEGKLSANDQIAANSAAHKLAGILGTFGLTRGTVLARELELLYSPEDEPDPSYAPRLTSIAAELHHLIETRQ